MSTGRSKRTSPVTRKFDGQTFVLLTKKYGTKQAAQRRAKNVRKIGSKARVVRGVTYDYAKGRFRKRWLVYLGPDRKRRK
jgi:hypothetical protein